MEPDNIDVLTLNKFQLDLSCEGAAFRAHQCIRWEHTSQLMRDRLGKLNVLLEEQGLVVAVAMFRRKGGLTYQRIYKLPAVAFDDGTCVTSTTWKRMCEAWRTMTVPERFELLKEPRLAWSLWEMVSNLDEEVMQ